jgi:hypothetical protein
MPVCKKCAAPFSVHVTIGGRKKNLQNRKYCLNCSPFGAHNTRPLHEGPRLPGSCRLCGVQLKKVRWNKCGACTTLIRRYRAKLAAISYLGGQCKRCGWHRHPAALQFHHLSDKDFTISEVANRSWSVILRELDKCELLCANCHIIEHSSRRFDPRVLAEVRLYRGTMFNGVHMAAVLDSFVSVAPSVADGRVKSSEAK